MNFEFGLISTADSDTQVKVSRWQPSRAQLRARLHVCLLLLDAICIFAGFFIASLIYSPGASFEQSLLTASVFVPIYLVVALNSHAYATKVIERPGTGVLLSIRSFAIAAGVILLAGFYFKTTQNFSRGTVGIGAGLSVVLLAFTRDIFLRKARKLLGGNPYSVVLITDGSQGISTTGSRVAGALSFRHRCSSSATDRR